eukprot:scaffold3043_cov180-Amphora_coffeaeformis.AAC.13
MMSTGLQTTTWPHEWLEECRDPVFAFSFREQAYGFYLFSLPTWIELLSVLLIHVVIAALFSVAIYYTVVVDKSRTSTITSMPFLLTFAVYLPFWILAPKTVLDHLQLQHKIFRFTLLVVTPTTSIFRLLEAYFGFTPAHAVRTAGDFAFYFGSPMIIGFDDKAQTYAKTSFRQIMRHLSRFLFLLFLTGMYQSMFDLHPSFPKFGIPASDDYYAWYHLVDPIKWRDTILYAILLQQYLTTFGEGLMFATNVLTGMRTEMRK